MVLIASYSEVNYAGSFWSINCQHACGTTLYSAYGQSFQTPSDEDHKITSAEFYLKRGSSAEGTLVAVLYASTGTYGTNAKPTGSPLATSSSVEMENIIDSFGLITFTFLTDQQYIMIKDTVYCIVVEALVLTTGTIPVGADSSLPSHGGNFIGYYNGNWVTTSTWDGIFYVYGDLLVIDTDVEINQFPDNVTNSVTAAAIESWLDGLNITTVRKINIDWKGGFYKVIVTYE